MLLTSARRILFYQGQSLTSKVNRRVAMDWVTAISTRIEGYLNRELELKEYTQYFDVDQTKPEYFPKVVPIFEVLSLKYNFLGNFEEDTNISVLDEGFDFIVGLNRTSIVLQRQLYTSFKSLELVHRSGLAEHGVNSIYTIDADTLIVADYWIVGQDSEAVGLVKSVDDDGITMEILSGIFQDNEDVNVFTNETNYNADTIAFSGTMNGVVSRALCESFPEIVRATEIEIRFMDKHKFDFENTATIQGQTMRRQTSKWTTQYELQPETTALLEKHKRTFIV